LAFKCYLVLRDVCGYLADVFDEGNGLEEEFLGGGWFEQE
jgi:hypothetical protein